MTTVFVQFSPTILVRHAIRVISHGNEFSFLFCIINKKNLTSLMMLFEILTVLKKEAVER